MNVNYENTNLKREKKEKKRTIHRFAQWNHTGETVPKQFQDSWVALLKVLTNIPILIIMLTIILILPFSILIILPLNNLITILIPHSRILDIAYQELLPYKSCNIVDIGAHGGDTTLPLALVARFP